MRISWKPAWYELDQTIVRGDTDYFYLSKDGSIFTSDMHCSEDMEVYGEVLEILHPELGAVCGIVAEGLNYRIYIDMTNFIQIDAEESPGKVEYPTDCSISDWNFEIEFNIHEVTGFSSEERMNGLTDEDILITRRKRSEKYKSLLGIQHL